MNGVTAINWTVHQHHRAVVVNTGKWSGCIWYMDIGVAVERFVKTYWMK